MSDENRKERSVCAMSDGRTVAKAQDERRSGEEELCPADEADEERAEEDQRRAEAEEDAGMEGQEDEESEEARVVKPAHDPGAPTKAEYDRHMLTHLPYRAWCPWCVTGRGRSAQHRRQRQEGEEGVPMVAMDFCFITEASTPVLCMKCSRTGVIVAHALPSKEVTPELVRLVAKDLDNMGHTRVVLKSDNEPAMKALAQRVKDICAHPTVIE